jgi:aspartate 1-decarboxylase
MADEEAHACAPRVVHVDNRNRIVRTGLGDGHATSARPEPAFA